MVRSSDHVKLWTGEKVVSVLNFPAIGIPLLYTTPLTDAIFCTVLVLHFHWGEILFAVSFFCLVYANNASKDKE